MKRYFFAKENLIYIYIILYYIFFKGILKVKTAETISGESNEKSCDYDPGSKLTKLLFYSKRGVKSDVATLDYVPSFPPSI